MIRGSFPAALDLSTPGCTSPARWQEVLPLALELT
jgi:hypothetical protein